MINKLLTVNQVADILGVKVPRIYELTRKGQLPFLVRLGGRQYRYNLQGLNEWLANGGNPEPKEDLTTKQQEVV